MKVGSPPCKHTPVTREAQSLAQRIVCWTAQRRANCKSLHSMQVAVTQPTLTRLKQNCPAMQHELTHVPP